MSYNLHSFQRGYIGMIWGRIKGVIKGDTRSEDYGSYEDV